MLRSNLFSQILQWQVQCIIWLFTTSQLDTVESIQVLGFDEKLM